jgi:cell division septum initiation protein DivIVA
VAERVEGKGCLSGGKSSYFGAMVDGESTGTDVKGPSPAAPVSEHEFGDLRQHVPRDILDVSSPIAVRGYEPGAVDPYIRRVNRAIAELKVSASPSAAVRHALDQAREKMDDLLRSAREAAEQITTSAREEAEENADRLKAEAVKFVVDTNAEADRLKAEADELTAKRERTPRRHSRRRRLRPARSSVGQGPRRKTPSTARRPRRTRVAAG